MARNDTLKAYRGTRANLNALAAASGLIAGELYAITDEGGRLAVGLTTSTYSAMDKEKGTTTNDNAASGIVGEFVESTILLAAAVNLTNNTVADITTMSLGAGDWDVFGQVSLNAGSGTTTSRVMAWLSTTGVTIPTQPNGGAYADLPYASAASLGVFIPVGQRRISLASPGTVYLSTRVTFAVSTCGAYGYLGARRAR